MDNRLFEVLYRVGVSLASEKDVDRVLERIVDEAISLAGCDGGTIYIIKGDKLHFKILKNNVLKQKFYTDEILDLFPLKEFQISDNSISGHVAKTRELLHLPDGETARKMGFTFDAVVLQGVDYIVESTLTIPLITGNNELVGVLQLVNARENGKITPFKDETIQIMKFFASQAAVALQNAKLLEEVKKIQLYAIYTLSSAAEFKDKVTGDHIKRISKVSYIIAKTLNQSREFCELILYASPMHDIGKVAIPDHILNKPDRLSASEWETMKKHVIYGSQIIGDSEFPLFQMAKRIALYHHERFDGNGYPFGLKGEEIPIEARIVQVADVFDALVSVRPYKIPWSFQDASDYIRDMKGEQFDPDVADAFLQRIELIAKLYHQNVE
ncbi:MAG: HD domain-containing phosphohydrolase [candidate division WOR-3 bacterium]